ncbi:hypothetical protein ANABIO32_00480 [Rossellomorea marisflavi]|uniref:DUF4942 domain-containing protein n=1 Tax=Rossellomorea marisflavi TaxID=189381 RepID=UPI0025CB3925|nr:DUF4942 domain-containing protein [Rossellomorea marisflavi]GLI82362.1 hypothetical protein ANABIO32_00480 [Rossellomorea marisflavi]
MFTSNPDFYPTPKALQKKMLSKLDFRYISSVLEPSAGRGDLVEGIEQEMKLTNSYRKSHDIDLIEIDQDLISVLKGKGKRVIHDNFLSFDTYKRYDVIIANFPFSEGDKHLLKAIELQERGGQVVALLNAETLKNPYTNTRKQLVRLLDKHNAEVEFIQEGFTEADRKTNVETALVYINIPKVENESLIINDLKQDESYKVKSDLHSTSLANADFIKGIVQQYNYEVKAGLQLIEEYEKLKPLMLRSFKDSADPVLKLELGYKDEDGSSIVNGYIKQIRLKYWTALFSNDQFMSLFTSNLKRKYLEYVQELKDYDFSFYNIYTLRIQLNNEMIQGVEDTILNLFEEFSYKHYYDESSKNVHLFDGWKTNKAYKINRKVIIPLSGYDEFWSKYKPTHYQVLDKLKDIEKVFTYLDDGNTEHVDLVESLTMAEHYEDTKKIELKFFTVSFFKKGTCHIEFNNMDLLKKFNLFGSNRKGWLPPSYGKASYSEMSKEEREVIDNFEGEASYNDVMANKGYFIQDTREMLKLTS